MFGWLRRKKKTEALPSGVEPVPAGFSASVQRRRTVDPNAMTMDKVLHLAVMEAYAAGISDAATHREWKMKAREDFKEAQRKAAAGESEATFTVGIQTITVAPP